MKHLLLFLFLTAFSWSQEDIIFDLRKKWGPEIHDCLEALPALEKEFAAGAESGSEAARRYLSHLGTADRASFLKRLEATLIYRRMIEELTDRIDGRFHGVILKIPQLSSSYLEAAKLVGVSSDGKSASEFASGLSSGQDSYLLTRIALALAQMGEAKRLATLGEIVIQVRTRK